MEELVFNFDESEAPKKKEVITYEPVEKGIRRKLKDGKKFSYEATADFGRVEVYDEELKKFVKKQDKRRKTFKALAEARIWLHQIEVQKAEAKEKKVVFDCGSSKEAGLCSEERSLISPDYARNFICDFILGDGQTVVPQQRDLFDELEK